MTGTFELNVASLLGMRRHLSIVHHKAGRP